MSAEARGCLAERGEREGGDAGGGGDRRGQHNKVGRSTVLDSKLGCEAGGVSDR
jgi:hypothetical protein